jgi:hypothetical protein
MIKSQQVQEWMAMGEAKGNLNTRIDSLLEALTTRFPREIPADLEAAIRASMEREQLRSWLMIAVTAESLDAFRQASGL